MANRLTLAEAVATLRGGGVLAYPTEAVWGLGCDPMQASAVTRLLALKQRPVEKGLILIGASLAQFDGLLAWDDLPPPRVEAVQATWPGPHTWIVPATPAVPKWITGAHRGVAVRVSAHPLVAALCDAFAGPLVSTSANPAGLPPPRMLAQFEPRLLTAIDGLLDGAVGALEQPTPIRDAATGEVLRG